MENGKQPINPIFGDSGLATNLRNLNTKGESIGLTKREYFVAMILQGVASNPDVKLGASERVRISIEMADELLKQLEK